MKRMILMALVCLAGMARADETVVQGRLTTEMAAIGGETTGLAVETEDGLFVEIRVSDPELLDQVLQWNGQDVEAKGEVVIETGVEIPEREVLHVAEIHLTF